MNKRFFFPVLLIVMLLLSGCHLPTPQSAAPSATPNPTALPPTPIPPTATSPEASPVVSAPVPLPIGDIAMFADGSGWGASQEGNRVFHSADGALTWADVTPPLESGDSASHFFLDGKTAWLNLSRIETSSDLYATYDSGASWSHVSLDFPGGALYFLDATRGFLLSDLGVGAGSNYVALYYTADGGQTWQQRFAHTPGQGETSLPAGGIKNGLSFLDEYIGWVTGSAPISDALYLYGTINSGTSWFQQGCTGLPVGAGGSFFEPQPVIPLGSGVLLLPMRAMAGMDSLLMYYCQSDDRGQSWHFVSQFSAQTQQTSVASDLSALAFGEDRLFSSLDGGLTWQDISAALPAGMLILDAERLDVNVGYLVVTDANTLEIDQNFIYKTTDGGQTWSPLPALVLEPSS